MAGELATVATGTAVEGTMDGAAAAAAAVAETESGVSAMVDQSTGVLGVDKAGKAYSGHM